ncbi:MAG TPA: hypothetical protein HA341_00705 [Halobacteria archaeon]|nr:hypothetical protein [Halobacteria archaeon]
MVNNKNNNDKDSIDDILDDDEFVRMLVYLLKRKAGDIADEMRTGKVSSKNGEIVKDLCQMVVDRERGER